MRGIPLRSAVRRSEDRRYATWGFLLLVGNRSSAVFIDQRTVVETVDGERCSQWVHFTLGQARGKYVARARCCLEAAGAPTAVEEHVRYRGFRDDRACIRGGVDDAAPLTVHTYAGQHREHLDNGLDGVFDHRVRAALAVAHPAVDARADHQVALVGLADVAVYGVGHDHAVDNRFDRLGHQRLQRVRFDRQTETGQFGHVPGVTGSHHTDALGADEALVGFNTDAHAVFLAETDHFGLLDQVHAEGVGGTREAPGHGIVTSHAATALNGCAQHRVAGVPGAVEVRNLVGHLLGIEQFAIDAVEAVGADPTLGITNVLQGVAQVVNATLGEHHVVVQVLGQAFPQFHRVFVQVRGFVPQVVGTHDGGVARGVTAAQPALLDHGHVSNAVFLGEVIRRRQTMPAAADDNDVVDFFRGWRAPHALPVFVVAEGVFEEAEARIALHSHLLQNRAQR